MGFFKRLLWLVKSTPLYLLRVEFRIRALSVAILRRTLRWMKKIHEMEEDRLPAICFKKMIEKYKQDSKYNWFNKIRETVYCAIDQTCGVLSI